MKKQIITYDKVKYVNTKDAGCEGLTGHGTIGLACIFNKTSDCNKVFAKGKCKVFTSWQKL